MSLVIGQLLWSIMQALGAILACLAAVSVSAFPVMFLAYTDGRAETRRGSLLDCSPPTDGSPLSYRCRPMNQNSPRLLPRPEDVSVIEIVEDDLGGREIVEIVEEIEPWRSPVAQLQSLGRKEETQEQSYVITVPKQNRIKKPRCQSHQVYVSEVDLCVDKAGHMHPEALVARDDDSQPKPVVPVEDTTIIVGYEKRKKCPAGQIYVPEVDMCSDINPVILPPKSFNKKKDGMRKDRREDK